VIQIVIIDVPDHFLLFISIAGHNSVMSRRTKTISALNGWPTDLSARRVRLSRDFKSPGSPAHREVSRKCELKRTWSADYPRKF